MRLPHFCHATDCNVRVPPSMFMCKTHWYELPKTMRDELLAAYVPGQETRKDPSPEYLDVAMRCVELVAFYENQDGCPND